MMDLHEVQVSSSTSPADGQRLKKTKVDRDSGESERRMNTLAGASASKIGPLLRHLLYDNTVSEDDDFSDKESSEEDTKNIIWGSRELFTSLRAPAVCSVCLRGKLSLEEKKGNRQGWGTKISWVCSDAECSSSLQNKWYPTSTYENKSYKINRTLVLGMRAICNGRSATAKLSAYLGLLAPIHQRHWRRHTKELSEKVSECVDESLDAAALKWKRRIIQDSSVRLDDNDQLRATVVDSAVSVDGSWLTSGFYSRHGFVAVVSLDTGECSDRIYMCSSCRECKRWEWKPKTSSEYMEFFEDHFLDCPVNHEGSAQTIKSGRAEQLFFRSAEHHNFRYTRYIGDSKSYLQVKAPNPMVPLYRSPKTNMLAMFRKEWVQHFEHL